MRRYPSILAALSLAGVLVAPAGAGPHTVTSTANTFAPAEVTVARGESLDYVNADVAPHNITSSGTTPTGKLLFGSDTITSGQRTTVRGVEQLAPGTYPYFCTVHEQMRGSIVVTDAAQPVPEAPRLVPAPTGATVASPTSITFFEGALYVTSYAGNDVTKLPVLTGGVLGAPERYATGFDQPLGLAFAPDGTMYVADSHASGTGRVGRVTAVPRGGGAVGTVGQVVVDGLPNGRHATNGLAVSNGRLYIANGNNTDDGTGVPADQPLSGTLLSVPLTARRLPAKASKTLLVEARGLRNPYDVAFRPGTAEAWFATNGPDALDPYGEDLLHKVDVRAATADYGFPACVYKAGPAVGQNPKVTTKCSAKVRRPEIALGLHVSANGLAFGPAEAPWHGDLFVAEYGNNPGEDNAGHKVVRIPMTGAHAGTPVDVITLPSPLDVAFGPPGTGLYVADFASGQILMLSQEG